MRHTFLTILFAALLFSCTSLQNIVESNETLIPSIGTIGQLENSLLSKNFKLVGSPNLEKGIPLSIREIQFGQPKFKAYSDLKTRQGQQPSVTFVDSLPIKPKYLCLEIADIIALQSQLNSDYNAEVRSYLENDADIQIVSQIAFLVDTEKVGELLEAEGLFLTQCKDGLLGIELLSDGKRKSFEIHTMEIFDYKLSGFCWNTDRYRKARIASISFDGAKCPGNTEKDARNLSETKSYLKL